jgi:hypothetical protein
MAGGGVWTRHRRTVAGVPPSVGLVAAMDGDTPRPTVAGIVSAERHDGHSRR